MPSENHFELFGFAHFTTLFVILLTAVILVWIARNQNFRHWIKPIGIILASLLLINESIYLLGAVNLGLWNISWGLPLQICDLAIIAAAFSLIKHNQFVWEVAYFWGLGGTLQALLTPDLSVTFPDYIFIKFFLTHGIIVIAVIFLAGGCRRPITKSSVWRMIWVTNAYSLFVYLINIQLNTNYLYLRMKPAGASILDFMGPWPVYLIGLEVLMIASFWIYFLPFGIANHLRINHFKYRITQK